MATNLARAVTLLSRGVGAPEQDYLDALKLLSNAPPEDVWNRALTLGLSHCESAIRKAATQECIARLDRFREQREANDAMIDALLDFCFVDQDPQTMESRVVLLRTITKVLLANPFMYEHHRARLLMRSGDIQYMAYQPKTMVDEAVWLQDSFAEEAERSDVTVVQRLSDWRKLDAYTTQVAPDSTLVAYLQRDRRLSYDAVSSVLLDAYRDLILRNASIPLAANAAISNLRGWLERVPRDHGTRSLLAQTILADAVSNRSLHGMAHLHVRVHRALLMDRGSEGDLFQILRTFTDGSESQIPRSLLQLLALLPSARQRLFDLSTYLNSPLVRRQQADFWEAVVDVAKQLVTGADTIQYLCSTQPATVAENQDLQRQLDGDRHLRASLRRLALDPAVATREIRQKLWRVLLCCYPRSSAERHGLYTEVLEKLDHELYHTTIEVSAKLIDRDVWWYIEKTWDQLTATDAAPQERRERLRVICNLVHALRPLDLSHAAPTEPHPLVRLACEDSDAEVRSAVRDTLQRSGYRPLLDYEEQQENLASQRRHRNEISRSIADLRGQIEANQRQIDQVRRSLQSYQLEQHNLHAEIVALEGRNHDIVKSVESIIARLRSRSEILADRITSHQQQIEDLERQIAKLQSDRKARTAQIEQLKADRRRLRAEIVSLQGILSNRLMQPPSGTGSGAQPPPQSSRSESVTPQQNQSNQPPPVTQQPPDRDKEVRSRLQQKQSELQQVDNNIAILTSKISGIKAGLDVLEQSLDRAQEQDQALNLQYEQIISEQQAEAERLSMERLNHERQVAPLTRRLGDLDPLLKELSDQLNGLIQIHTTAELRLQGKQLDQQQMDVTIGRSIERRKELQSQCRSAERMAAVEAIGRRDEQLKQLQIEQTALACYADALERCYNTSAAAIGRLPSRYLEA